MDFFSKTVNRFRQFFKPAQKKNSKPVLKAEENIIPTFETKITEFKKPAPTQDIKLSAYHPVAELFNYLDTTPSENLLPIVKKAKAFLPMAQTELRKDNRIHIEFKSALDSADFIAELRTKPFKITLPPTMATNQDSLNLDPTDNVFLWSLLEIKKVNWLISIGQDGQRIKSIRISSLS